MQPTVRKIIHIDMDAFYAAVEQRDFPEYQGKPIIVGGNPFSRGVVATCSYEARPYGIHSAMPCSRAYRLCPQAIFLRPRFDVYREVSKQIRRIFFDYTDLVEPLSLDEAYLDVTECREHSGSATLIAKAIKDRIKRQTQLTASAGISYNKFLAKIASDLRKPDGIYLITPEQGQDFIDRLPIEKFHGIGSATAKKMHGLGVRTGADLKELSLVDLQMNFGKSGSYFFNIARGVDHRPVVSFRKSQSVGVENTYTQDILDRIEIITELQRLFDTAYARLCDKRLMAHTLTIKLKYHDFVQITRSRTFAQTITPAIDKNTLINELLQSTDVGHRAVRLLGITLSSLTETDNMAFPVIQADLFESEKNEIPA